MHILKLRVHAAKEIVFEARVYYTRKNFALRPSAPRAFDNGLLRFEAWPFAARRPLRQPLPHLGHWV